MEEVAIVCKDRRKVKYIERDIKKSGFILSSKPELVISHGGDGTFLISERKYPGIVKLITRDSKICRSCSIGELKDLLGIIKEGKYKVEEIRKLALLKWRAVNDIIIRSKKVNQAIRFKVKVDSRKVDDELIGDGIVVATPFGSSGYFYSITGKKFKNGIGLAFNNLNNSRIRSLILKEDSEVRVEIVRGDAVISYDNFEGYRILKSGDKAVIRLSNDKARILRIV